MSQDITGLLIKYLNILLNSKELTNEQKAEVQYLLNFITTYDAFTI